MAVFRFEFENLNVLRNLNSILVYMYSGIANCCPYFEANFYLGSKMEFFFVFQPRISNPKTGPVLSKMGLNKKNDRIVLTVKKPISVIKFLIQNLMQLNYNIFSVWPTHSLVQAIG